jgi:hypothetical protein
MWNLGDSFEAMPYLDSALFFTRGSGEEFVVMTEVDTPNDPGVGVFHLMVDGKLAIGGSFKQGPHTVTGA